MRCSLKLITLLSINSIKSVLFMRAGSIIFLIGKILRFVLFLFFIIGLTSSTKIFAGYTQKEVIFFFLTFNLIDTLGQMMFREVYRFRQLVVSGELTGILVKPYHPFIRILFGGIDFFDFLVLIPLIIIIIFVGASIQTPFHSFFAIFLYILFIFLSFIISMSFHIIVLSLGIIATEVDHAVMIYRDLSGLARLPISIYQSPFREIFTFIIPIGIMVSFPVYMFLGKLAPILIGYTFCFTGIFFIFSILLWKSALKKYQGWGG